MLGGVRGGGLACFNILYSGRDTKRVLCFKLQYRFLLHSMLKVAKVVSCTAGQQNN